MKKYKHFNRLLSMLLVVAALFGMMALPANAASLADSGTVTIQQTGYRFRFSKIVGFCVAERRNYKSLLECDGNKRARETILD